MFSEKWKKEVFTVPNLLSLFRIGLIPVYVSLYRNAASRAHYFLAGSVLAFSCMTDIADGIIARKFQLVTNTGKILDPLADKLTQLALILCLSANYPVLYPILGLFALKELFQCGALIFFAWKGKALPGALWAGKVCTTVLFISLTVLVLFPQIGQNYVFGVTMVNAGFLLFSFKKYVSAYFGSCSCLEDLKREP